MNFVLLMVTTAPLTRSTSGATDPASVATAPGGGAAPAEGASASELASSAALAAVDQPRLLAAVDQPRLLAAVDHPRLLAAVDDDSARRVIRGQRHGDLVTEDDTDAVLPELAAEVRQDLVPVLELDAEISRRQHLDDAPLKFYMLFAAHGGANLTRSQGTGQ
jgi:hypothetical protein